ncbi:MAG: Na/Pi cotransporter family protein [Clostridia bacterium]|nr:Na/Pi cotransporter family protein [Clostridia bacterium]
MSITNFFLFLGGLGAFLFGVKVLSDNMEKLANRRLKSLFQKTSKNPLVGIGVGAVTTAIVQSSGLTTVMVIGFVNAGLMSLYQATAFIMGANIGTTITAQIAALQSFDFATFAIALTFVGIVITMVTKKPKINSIGLAIAGLGLVFMGLELMNSSMSALKEEPVVTQILNTVTNPFLLLVIGVVATTIMQSSSAITTIIISVVNAGLVIGGGGNAVLFLVLGSNIGSCTTSMISAIGTNRGAKRASLIHLLFNVFGSALFFVLLVLWPDFMAVTFEKWFPNLPGTQIAMFHTFFNVICTVVFVPFISLFVKIAELLIKDTKKKEEQSFIDERFLSAPTVAIEQSNKEAIRMADKAMGALKNGFTCFIKKDADHLETVRTLDAEVNEMSKRLTDYLIDISSFDLTVNDEKRISILHNNILDIVRIAEIADNFIKYTLREVQDELVFSPGVNEKLTEMFAKLEELYELTKQARLTKDRSILPMVDAAEEQLDAMRKTLIGDHIERLNHGECSPANSSVYINLVSNLERAGDHLSFMAHTIEEVEYSI